MNHFMPRNLMIQMKGPLLSTQNTQEIDSLNMPLSIKETESIIHNLPKQKALRPDCFTGEFYHIFKKEIIQFSTSDCRS